MKLSHVNSSDQLVVIAQADRIIHVVYDAGTGAAKPPIIVIPIPPDISCPERKHFLLAGSVRNRLNPET